MDAIRKITILIAEAEGDLKALDVDEYGDGDPESVQEYDRLTGRIAALYEAHTLLVEEHSAESKP